MTTVDSAEDFAPSDGHDAECESFFVEDAHAWTPCRCEERTKQGLAWDIEMDTRARRKEDR
jgi:hypothetical protein